MARTATETRLRMSYDDYLAFAEDRDIAHSEWVDGEVTVFMAGSTRHQDLSMFLATLLNLFVTFRRLGKVNAATYEMKLRAGRSYREPDLLSVANEHLDRREAKRLSGPADLVIEILSDDDPHRDTIEKFEEYAVAGIPEYWIVEGRDGRSGFELFFLDADGRYARQLPTHDGWYVSRVLPGFWLDPAWLVAEPLPDVVDCLLAIAPDFLSGRS